MATVGSIVIDSQCYKKGKVVVIEIMGRNAGWLTAAPDLLPDHTRPDLFYLPEKPFVLESFLNDVKLIYAKQGYVVACVSEGLTFPRDNQNARLDSFGHIQLGGAAHDLVGIVEKTLDLPTRAIELSLPQRSNEVLISKVDQDEALAIGKMAVQEAINGVYGKMISITRLSTDPYEVKLELVPLDLIANEERIVPASMFLNKHEMSKEYRDYLRPLVMGEIAIKYENGVPKTSHFKYHKVVA
jgi:6-phosphofructokinase 1